VILHLGVVISLGPGDAGAALEFEGFLSRRTLMYLLVGVHHSSRRHARAVRFPVQGCRDLE